MSNPSESDRLDRIHAAQLLSWRYEQERASIELSRLLDKLATSGQQDSETGRDSAQKAC